ncbi:restriction endonuclease subunit S [Xanthomonas oryzae]|uniref:restriction endonuclease subunit S n=1 Tax=Xanthomonas oryzae TaxID=347 RepID=UPI000DDDF2BD|nr:restriction endonuclease subunit S [Xanthomonas oryzae]RBJ36458.1 type I restriction endonuclease subunit S [Xanthomonas oryzae pv. oryzae]
MNAKVEHWATIGFDDAFDQISTTGKTVKTAGLPTEGSYPVIDQGQAPLAGFLDSPELVISNESPIIIFGDHTRAVKWVDCPFIPGADGVKVLALREPLDARFFYYHLRSLHLESKGYARHFSQVRDASYCLPPLAEQKRIAQKLDALLAQVDTLKARIDAIPALLKRFRQAVRASALKGDLLSDSKEDSSAWNECTLSDLASVETGKTPDRSEANYWQAGSIPWVTSAATGLSFCKEAKEFVTPLAMRECSLKLFSPGTLLLAMYGEGKTRGQVTELKIQAACNQACAAISVNGDLALQSFVKLRLEENYEAIRKMAVGGNQPNLNLGKVREIQFSLPSIATQTEIVRRVEQLFAYADQLEAKVAAAQQRIDALTQSLLAKAFRGELVPQDPSDEPASVLLERIRTQRAAAPKPKRGRKAATS